MPKNKNPFSQRKSKNGVGVTAEVAITPGKTNTINDGVKNAGNQQNLSAKVNMPRGAKKPRNTPK